MSKSYNVLITDDSSFSRLMTRRFLEYSEFKVVGAAENGLEAIQLFPDLNPDILLLDILMPECDGLEVLSQIRAVSSDVIIVMATSMENKESKKAALDLGANYYLIKPFTAEILLNVFRDLVKRYK